MTMNCLKVFIILWFCNIPFEGSVTAAVRGDINVYESNQKYCGELLERTIEIFCIEIPRRHQISESQKNHRNTIEAVRKSKNQRKKHRFLIKHCCVNECSLNFIKSNCPGTRKRNKNKNTGVVQYPSHPRFTNKTITTARPQDKMTRVTMKDKTFTASLPTTTTTTTRGPTTTTTTIHPTTTTTTTRRPTTTTTTIRPTTITTSKTHTNYFSHYQLYYFFY